LECAREYEGGEQVDEEEDEAEVEGGEVHRRLHAVRDRGRGRGRAGLGQG
jgi:hypothetical protein